MNDMDTGASKELMGPAVPLIPPQNSQPFQPIAPAHFSIATPTPSVTPSVPDGVGLSEEQLRRKRLLAVSLTDTETENESDVVEDNDGPSNDLTNWPAGVLNAQPTDSPSEEVGFPYSPPEVSADFDVASITPSPIPAEDVHIPSISSDVSIPTASSEVTLPSGGSRMSIVDGPTHTEEQYTSSSDAEVTPRLIRKARQLQQTYSQRSTYGPHHNLTPPGLTPQDVLPDKVLVASADGHTSIVMKNQQ